MEHVELARQAGSRADLARRLTGAYYTPPRVAERLGSAAAGLGGEPVTVAEPFCGDGRLVVSYLVARARAGALGRLRSVLLWDLDASAVHAARGAVRRALAELGLAASVRVSASARDSFALAPRPARPIDVVLTNPPWDLLKPDPRDGVPDAADYRSGLRSTAAALAAAFPAAVSARGKAPRGHGVNLARAGALLALDLARPGGVLGLVLPAALFADQASAPFRAELFTRLAVEGIDAYPAEARLFAGVDQPFVVLTGRVGASTGQLRLRRWGREGEPLDTRELTPGQAPGAPLPLGVAPGPGELAGACSARHPALATLETAPAHRLWLGRELDETRIAEAFTDSPRGVPLLRGRHVLPFTIVRERLDRVDPRLRRIPATCAASRLAWRDVSRPTQARRMQVALVPPGDVTGNSLGVGHFRAGDPEALRVLLAVLSSFVLELQVRARLATAHVSLGVLRGCAIPADGFAPGRARDTLLGLVAARLRSETAAPRLEVSVARAYGLGRDDLACALEAFPRVPGALRAACLDGGLWR